MKHPGLLLPVTTGLLITVGLLTSRLFAASEAAPASSPACAIGSRLELFVDRFLVDRMTGTELRLATPKDMGTVLKLDAPWEGSYCGYFTVIKDGGMYRMYYRGKPENTPTGSPNEVTCCAESKDGVTWYKPEVGIFEINGDRRNNVVVAKELAPICSTDFTPFLDTRPGVPKAERYKALGGRFNGPVGIKSDPALPNGGANANGGLIAFSSPDGLHWKKISEEPVLSKKNLPHAADPSIQPTFWSESEQCYVALIRTRTTISEVEIARSKPGYRVQPSAGDMRWIGRATSPDYINWSMVEMTDYDSPAAEQIYNNSISPYFRASHIYVGLAARIVFDHPVITPDQGKALGIIPRYINDSSEPVLMTSRGGLHLDRTFLEALVRNGIGPEDWTSRSNYPAMNIVPTGTNEMSFYVHKGFGHPVPWVQRYTLGTDRIASVNARYSGGEMVTKPLTFTGKNLFLNLSTSVAGSVRVEIQDAAGTPIKGFTLADAVEITGNEIARSVSWKGGADLSAISKAPIRLRFVMKEADLYALQFQ